MKQWLSAIIGVDVNEFVVLKHYSADDADGYESIVNETETIHDAYYAVQRLSVKLRSPLKENEKLVRIIRFDRESSDQDKWPTLFSIPATIDMLIRTLLMRCQEQMKKIYATQYDLSQLRLREVIVGSGAPVLFLSDQLGRRGHDWNKNLYLQILPDEEVARIKMHTSTVYPVMVRRWKSSVLEVTSLVELMVPLDRQDQVAALKEQISFYYRVPFDQIQLSEAFPTTAWSKWPYTRDRVDLYDNVTFTSGKTPSTGTFNGKLVYFKLANEQVRRLTEEEKRTMRYKDSASKPSDAANSRRKERPLRIQLSTSITEED
uniref:Ubiquitinyl hydrolase 1 n=1 Tax=Setaria digitata TaxID=48799 RepID=A0A915Q5G9_9BILA